MPTLVLEHFGKRSAGSLNGRVLIGRRLTHGIVIPDPAVSRLHAWIENKEGAFVLTDAGSRTGTIVNGESVIRCELQHGDKIQIGPANLTFSNDAVPPADVEPLDLTSSPIAAVESSKSGILFDCQCGAPLWVGAELAGKKGLCKYCGEPVTVPMPWVAKEAAKARAGSKPSGRLRPAVPTLKRARCGVCHTDIDPGDEATTCPDCGTTFHTDCWYENYGCSTYGCARVNALKPAALIAEEARTEAIVSALNSQPVDAAGANIPWEVVLLGGSVVGTVVGALLFGVPTFIVGVTCLILLTRGNCRRRRLLAGAWVISIIGTLAGLALSDFWWFEARHLESLAAYLKNL